ncbi:probable poly(beta-D-mannuronate) O-acetylase [Jejuia pallidilutea]|uniref:Probable poly(Beta-D-mannuronate) O-acetylase n=1 Tax=Jejuia pallidilutea TaxID=504487 RepID=A0A090W5L1_9FLAO|nr:probable poly(beta-D-mannuronate) O-acetylase [Jejuia pallidilutea]
MVFNSLEFFVFLPIVFIVYWFFLKRTVKGQNLFLLLASYFFYGWWDWRFLSLIFLSTVVDYLIGLKIHANEEKHKRKLWLWCSVVFNVGLLGFFKYFNFFIDSWIDACHLIGYDIKSTWTLRVLLPVGISFYTFQTMSYSFDIYYKRLNLQRISWGLRRLLVFFPS